MSRQDRPGETRPPASAEAFATYFAWFLLLAVIASFGGKAIFDAKDLPPMTGLHYVHGVAMLSWFVLFALQPTLIRRGRIGTHRLLGRLSPLVVLTFIGFAIPISQLNWSRMGDPLIVTANGINLVLFIGLYLAALHWRRRPETHMRLMIYASLMLMGPAAGRIPEIFDRSPLLAVPIIFALQLAPVVHDVVTRRRVHPATWVGFGIALAAIPLILGLSGSEAWAAQLGAILGTPGGSGN